MHHLVSHCLVLQCNRVLNAVFKRFGADLRFLRTTVTDYSISFFMQKKIQNVSSMKEVIVSICSPLWCTEAQQYTYWITLESLHYFDTSYIYTSILENNWVPYFDFYFLEYTEYQSNVGRAEILTSTQQFDFICLGDQIITPIRSYCILCTMYSTFFHLQRLLAVLVTECTYGAVYNSMCFTHTGYLRVHTAL